MTAQRPQGSEAWNRPVVALSVEDAVVRFGDQVAVDHVDLAVASTETVAVLGPSGCGKTTLLRAIAGLQRLDAGRIRWDGDDLAKVPPHERRFGLMFQEYALFPHRDVPGNVEFGLRMAGTDRAARHRRVEEVLALVGLHEFRNRAVATLSGGEQQRVALARALAAAPRLMMLDEPLGALDRAWRVRLIDEIRTLLDRAALPAVYVTHDHDEAFAIAARVAVMRAGRIVQQGAPADVWRRPVDAWVAAFLGFGAATPAVARVATSRHPGVCWRHPPGRGTGASKWCCVGRALRPDARGPIAGVITHAAFSGELVTLTVEPACGTALTVRPRNVRHRASANGCTSRSIRTVCWCTAKLAADGSGSGRHGGGDRRRCARAREARSRHGAHAAHLRCA